jgi:hypothetical protein
MVAGRKGYLAARTCCRRVDLTVMLSTWMGYATLEVTAIDADALGAGFLSARLSALICLRPRQGVLAGLLDQLLGDGEAHQRAPDVGLGCRSASAAVMEIGDLQLAATMASSCANA